MADQSGKSGKLEMQQHPHADGETQNTYANVAENTPSNFANAHAMNPTTRAIRSKFSPDFHWLALHCLGFGACWGWVHVAFFSPVLWGQTDEALSLAAWLVNICVNGLAMVGLGLLSLRMAPLSKRFWLVVTLVALTAGGTIGISFGQAAGEGVVFVGSAISGIGTAGILLLWAEAYRSISPVIAKKYTIPWSLALGVLYYLVLCIFPPLLAVIATTTLPILSIVLLYRSNRLRKMMGGSPEEETENVEESTIAKTNQRTSWHKALPLRFAACAAVYCIPTGFIRGYPSSLAFAATESVGALVFAGVAIVMIVVAVASILFVNQKQIDLAYKLVVPLMAAGLLLLPFLAPAQEAAVGICIMSGYILFEAYVWASLSDIAANVTAPSALVFGVGKSGMNVGLLVGTFIGIWLGSTSGMLLIAISLLMVYMFIVVENVLRPKGSVALPLHIPSTQNASDSQPQKVTIVEAAQMDLAEVFSAMLASRCRTLSERSGLSARETEVLEYLAKGRSLQSIADTLGVAYSTVKTHTDHIYAKTDVHSRQELIELLERIDEE